MTAPILILESVMRAALRASQPVHCMQGKLPAPPKGRTVVVGAGKAAAAMAVEVERAWRSPLSGCVVTRYGSGLSCKHIQVLEASHPTPDANSVAASERILKAVERLTEDDLVIVLLSGGGSSLLCAPAVATDLEEKHAITSTLLKSGAAIGEINCVRKHISRIKGGRLARAAFPARIVNVIISDVVGNDVSAIASGPTVFDPTTTADALRVLDKYAVPLSTRLRTFLENAEGEAPKAGEPWFDRVANTVVASPEGALEAAADEAQRLHVKPIILGADFEGTPAEIAEHHLAAARAATSGALLLSGGEATLKVRGRGKGGPNLQFCLELLKRLSDEDALTALAIDTDGVDGNSGVAGAMVTAEVRAKTGARALDIDAFLKNNDSFGFFSIVSGIIDIGHTQTNVNDFRAVYVGT